MWGKPMTGEWGEKCSEPRTHRWANNLKKHLEDGHQHLDCNGEWVKLSDGYMISPYTIEKIND